MIGILSALIIIASILLVIVVFIQNPKGGGISSDFGSAQQLGGVQRTSDFVEKATFFLAGVIGVCAIVMTTMSTDNTKKAPVQTEQPAQKGPAQAPPAGTPAQ